MNIPFLAGPARYVPRGPWRPVWALLVAILITAVAIAIALLAGFLAAMRASGVSPDDLDLHVGSEGFGEFLVVTTLVTQLVTIGLAWLVAGWRGGPRSDVLQLSGSWPTLRDVIVAFLALIGTISLINGAFYLYDAAWFMESYRSDVKDFMALLKQPVSPWIVSSLLAAFVLGAPLSEELFFRGFLLSGLAKTRWGFWPAAILVTLLWTALHGYSLIGTIGVVTFGIFFSWMLWRTGNIWLPLICHALVNAWAFLAVAYIANQ